MQKTMTQSTATESTAPSGESRTDALDIGEVQKAIRAMHFPRLVIFADVIDRYVDIELKGKVNWLKASALIVLITRGGSLTLGEFAKCMLRPNNSITKLTDSLVKEGLVRRYRGGKDRRTVRVKVTQVGLSFMMETLKNIDLPEQEIKACLNSAEIEALATLTSTLRRHFIDRIGN
jgi:DNA-binding MarR family transcriptional regulator